MDGHRSRLGKTRLAPPAWRRVSLIAAVSAGVVAVAPMTAGAATDANAPVLGGWAASAAAPGAVDALREVKLFSPFPKRNAYFGEDVAVDGETVVVGEPDRANRQKGPGAAWVFVKTGGTWQLQAKLTDPALAAGSEFGAGVAIDGDTIVVGAPRQRTAGGQYGVAYVFVRSGTTWSKQAELYTPDGVTHIDYGEAVGVDGDTVVVGAPLLDLSPNYTSGAVYVYVRDGETWSRQKRLVSDDGKRDYFGDDLSLDGNTLAVGAVRDTSPTTAKPGAVYVFTRTGSAWTRQAKLYASDQEELVEFGHRVALDGDTLAVGTGLGGERAYVFGRSGTTWSQQARLVPPGDDGAQMFGDGIAVHGDTVLVGESQAERQPREILGSVHVFVGTDSEWLERSEYFPAAGENLDSFGYDIDFDGATAVVGAPLAESPDGDHWAGAVYILER